MRVYSLTSVGKKVVRNMDGVDSDEMRILNYLRENRSADRKSTRLNSSHIPLYRMPSSA